MHTLVGSTTPLATTRANGSGIHAGSSYALSSFDLLAGLEVRVLAVAQVPAEVLRELQRSRSQWLAGHDAARLAA